MIYTGVRWGLSIDNCVYFLVRREWHMPSPLTNFNSNNRMDELSLEAYVAEN